MVDRLLALSRLLLCSSLLSLPAATAWSDEPTGRPPGRLPEPPTQQIVLELTGMR
jgi:hypothetical protein